MQSNRPQSEDPERRRIQRLAVRALWIAWWRARRLGRGADVGALLPPVAPMATTTVAPEDVFRVVDGVARIAVFWKRDKRCFYRAFAVAYVLHHYGRPACLEFGLKLHGGRRRQCHCWVTTGGRVIGETTDPYTLFPLPAGAWQGCVRYWLADGDTEGALC